MKRRTVLGAVGIGIASTAGCISQASPGSNPSNEPENTSTTTPTTRNPTTETEMSETERVSSGEMKRVTIGSGALSEDGSRKPHGVVLTNPTSEARTARLVIEDPDDSVVVDGTYRLESEATVSATLTDPLPYSATVSVPENGASESVDVELEWFDCNASSTTFELQSDGQLSVDTVSTMMACTNLDTAHVGTDDQKEITLGDGSLTGESERKPHGVTLQNPTDKSWTVRLMIASDQDTPLFDSLYTLDPSAIVVVTLTEVGHYHSTASLPGSSITESFEISPEHFDCNHSSTNVTVQADGQLQVRTVSTQMACDVGEDDENETDERQA